LLKSTWFFRTSIPSVTPVRSLTRCVEPVALGFIPRYFWRDVGIKRSSAGLPLCASRREPALGAVRAISHAWLRAAL